MDMIAFKEKVKQAHSMKELLVLCGFKPTNTTQRKNLSEIIHKHNIDTSHFGRNQTQIASRWTDEEKIAKSAEKATSMGSFLKLMGLKNIGSNYQSARKHLERLGINTSHFNEPGTSYRQRILNGNDRSIPLNEILNGEHPQYRTYHLKTRLLEEGIFKNVCSECGQGENWNGKELKMQIDHINGINNDHRLENLRMLCPNCHSQTETYAGKKRYRQTRRHQ